MVRSGIFQLLAGIIALALANGMDRWLQFQYRIARNNADFTTSLSWQLASGLFLLVLWFALAWIMLSRAWRSMLVSIILLILGLAAFVVPFAYLLIPIPPPPSFLVDLPPSAFAYTGIFVAVLGLLHLLVTSPIKTEG